LTNISIYISIYLKLLLKLIKIDMNTYSTSQRKGFTLLEILLVIAAIGILAAIVLVAINPNRQLAQARNAQRRADVQTILNSVYQYAIDNSGTLPTGVDTTIRNIISTPNTPSCTVVGTVAATANVSDFVNIVTPTYVATIPRDPQVASTGCSDYLIQSATGNRITVSAPRTELGVTQIAVTR
jgi:prepilin-type N-terminal cleavage/methylation domain-containing protein